MLSYDRIVRAGNEIKGKIHRTPLFHSTTFSNMFSCDVYFKMLISHMHLDHYGGLAEILWYRGARNVKDELTIC